MTAATLQMLRMAPAGFTVSDGLPDENGAATGWIVTDDKTGNWIWTGGTISIMEAVDRLWRHRPENRDAGYPE